MILLTIALPAQADKSHITRQQEIQFKNQDNGYFQGQWANYEADGFEAERAMVLGNYEANDAYGLNHLNSYSTFTPVIGIPTTTTNSTTKSTKTPEPKTVKIITSDSQNYMIKSKH